MAGPVGGRLNDTESRAVLVDVAKREIIARKRAACRKKAEHLARDAAEVQAIAAHFVAFDQRYPSAESSRSCCGDKPAVPAPITTTL